MDNTTELSLYHCRAQLELCLTLIEEAYESAGYEHHDIVKDQLQDILELFDRLPTVDNEAIEPAFIKNNILPFPLTSLKEGDH